MMERINVIGRDWPCALFIDVSEPPSMGKTAFKQRTNTDAAMLSDWLWGNLPQETTKAMAKKILNIK